MDQDSQRMTKRAFVTLLVVLAGLVVAAAISPFVWCSIQERRRVADAQEVFPRIEPLGCQILSNPCGGRYCSYIVEFPPETRLSDDNAAGLKTLNDLPVENDLSVIVNTSAITDNALPHLKALATLDTLDVTRTRITEEGIEALAQALPGCTVLRRKL
jgi:hypothetical protein